MLQDMDVIVNMPQREKFDINDDIMRKSEMMLQKSRSCKDTKDVCGFERARLRL